MSDLKSDFRRYWLQQELPQGQPVLLAVSGGIDSMVMAHLFHACAIPFAVAHCNFCLRGAEADKDEQLVISWCKERNIICHSIRFDTKARMAELKKGTQETARILRYQWFEQVREQHGYSRIATAHHADDNVETVLINLFRGTGISGLHGIRPAGDTIMRPLIFATRQQITDYAKLHDIPFRQDASNDSDDYLRNAVRHHIVPAVTRWFPDAVTQVTGSISRFAEAEILYDRAIEQERKKLVERRGLDYYVPLLKLKNRVPLATICYELFKPFGFASAQVQQIIDLINAETGRYITSPTHRLIKNRNFFILAAIPLQEADLIVIDELPCTVTAGKYLYTFSLTEVPGRLPEGRDTALIDAGQISLPLIFRRWKAGDYLYPLGMKMKKKKVARLLIDEKVPLNEKEEVRVLENDKRVVWISGLRLDERFKITSQTTQVLQVTRKLADIT